MDLKPTPPPSAYQLFSKAWVADWKRDAGAGAKLPRAWTVECGAAWKALPDSKKQKYVEATLAARTEYRKAVDKWHEQYPMFDRTKRKAEVLEENRDAITEARAARRKLGTLLMGRVASYMRSIVAVTGTENAVAAAAAEARVAEAEAQLEAAKKALGEAEDELSKAKKARSERTLDGAALKAYLNVSSSTPQFRREAYANVDALMKCIPDSLLAELLADERAVEPDGEKEYTYVEKEVNFTATQKVALNK